MSTDQPAQQPEEVSPPIFPDPENPRRSTLRLSGQQYQPVSEKLIPVKYISHLFSTVLGILVLIAYIWIGLHFQLFNADTWWYWLIAIIPVPWVISDLIEFFLIPRRVRAMGWAEREEDLLIREGLFFRHVSAIPYGRLQYLDINSGPLLRHYGICTVTIRTASTATSGTIEGVPLAEAERMRDELTARGQARMAGL